MRYELVERIGAGGMAEIFRGKALAAGGFEKPVAIKRILPHLSQDHRFVELLIKEAKILSQLRHRNIVQIFDVGVGPDGNYFLVMEYVEGADMGAIYEKLEHRRKRLPVDMALHICAEVCEALDYAHRAKGSDDTPLGIVHRDVSPANIMLSRSGEVKLTDFGIAKQAEETTGHGAVRGKFAYISPEQARNEHVDPRSDVFSLGIVLFELILGHRLYSSLPDFDALRAVREGRVPRPRDIDREVSPELEELLLGALAFAPNKRFATAGDFGTALRSYRYSLSSSGGDPAKEIARIVDRLGLRAASKQIETESTVVRIQTAAGFTISDLQAIATESDADPFAGARTLMDGFEEDEETRAREDSAGEREVTSRREFGAISTDLLDSDGIILDEDTDTDGLDTERLRAATPSIHDIFSSRMASGSTPSGELLLGSDPTEPVPRPVMSPAEIAAYHHARRRQIGGLSLSALVVAVVAFVITQAALGKYDTPTAAAEGQDAGAALADAGEEELVMPPDPIEPAKPAPAVPKKKPAKKKRQRSQPAR